MSTLKFGNVTIDAFKTKKAQQIFRAFNHKLRQVILDKIQENGNHITVTDLWVLLRLEQSVCSQHLAILRSAGMVKTQRDGKFIYYSVDATGLKKMQDAADFLLNPKV